MKRTSRIDVDRIIDEIRSAVSGIQDPHTDGYVGEGLKQDLHRIKTYLDREYADLPVYSNETQWTTND